MGALARVQPSNGLSIHCLKYLITNRLTQIRRGKKTGGRLGACSSEDKRGFHFAEKPRRLQ